MREICGRRRHAGGHGEPERPSPAKGHPDATHVALGGVCVCLLVRYRSVGSPRVQLRGAADAPASSSRRRKRREGGGPEPAFNLATRACGRILGCHNYEAAVSCVVPQHVPSLPHQTLPKKVLRSSASFATAPAIFKLHSSASEQATHPPHVTRLSECCHAAPPLQSPGTSQKCALACGPVPPVAFQYDQQSFSRPRSFFLARRARALAFLVPSLRNQHRRCDTSHGCRPTGVDP